MLTPEERMKLAERALDGDFAAENALEEDGYQRHKVAQDAKRDKYARSESKLQKEIAHALEDAGYMVIRVNSMTTQANDRWLRAYYVQNIATGAGHSDLVVYKGGRAWFLEVKTASGRQSQSQKRFQACAERYGMPYYVVRTPEEAIACLQQN